MKFIRSSTPTDLDFVLLLVFIFCFIDEDWGTPRDTRTQIL